MEKYTYKEAKPENPSYYQFRTFDSIKKTAEVCGLYNGAAAHYAGCVFKYILRAPKKNGSIDIKKLRIYYTWLLGTGQLSGDLEPIDLEFIREVVAIYPYQTHGLVYMVLVGLLTAPHPDDLETIDKLIYEMQNFENNN